jgi:hypothetical protein
MSYTLNKTDGTVVATVNDGTINTGSTSITLFGKNYAGWGEFQNENLIKILENFANNTTPANPLVGQVYFNTDTKLLNMFIGSGTWKTVGSSTSSATAPTSPAVGELWFDTVNEVVKVWNGIEWLLVGPGASIGGGGGGGGDSGLVATAVTNGVTTEYVLSEYADGNLIAVISPKLLTNLVNVGVELPGYGLTTLRPGYNFVAEGQLPDAGVGVYNAKKIEVGDTAQLIIATSGANSSITTAGNLTFVPTGNIGIGAAPGSYKVDVTGTVKSSAALVAGTHLRVEGSDTAITGAAGLGVELFQDATNGVIQAYNRTALALIPLLVKSSSFTVNTTQLVVNTSGNVGIGIAAPTAKTHIYGAGTQAAFYTNGDSIGQGLYLQASGGASGDGGQILFGASQGSFAGIKGFLTNGTGPAGDLIFQTRTTSGNIVERARISSTGTTSITGTLQTTAITAGADGTAGTLQGQWTLVGTSKITTTYADLAERYEADMSYVPGTIVKIGGTKEVTMVSEDLSEDVFGVVSAKAAFIMNGAAGDDITHPAIAMVGRVPVRVIGAVRKGDKIVSTVYGVGRAALPGEATAFNVVGRAIEDNNDVAEKLVTVAIK